MKDHDSLITLLDKQGREIRDQDKIIKRMEELYTEIHDWEHNTIIHTDPNEVLEIKSWKGKATLRDMKNRTAIGNDYIHVERLKAREDTISRNLLSCSFTYPVVWWTIGAPLMTC